MGFQSGINRALGTVAAGAIAIGKTLQERQKEANTQSEQKQAAQKTQKRNFKEYLKKLPTQFGGTLGELGENAVNEVAKQYSPAQRKQLMDTMDKEKKK